MRVETAQIYWHDKKPVYSIDFHPADPARFATAGGDNAIRVQPEGGPLFLGVAT